MTSRRISWPLRLICLFATAALAARPLEGRSEQTQARCSPDFDWASNSAGLSPCLLTAFVWGSCFTGNWNVPQLPQGDSYANPNSTTANLCTCSWAGYNLISACTACQGFDSAVVNWAAYDQSCSGFLTDSYFPTNVTLPAGTAIPFWAGTDPRTWNDGRFDSAQAQAVAQEKKPDFVQGQTTGDKKKKPIGAIVGGVVGGVAALAIVGTLVFLFIRKCKGENTDDTGAHPYIHRPRNGRSISDVSKSLIQGQSMSVIRSYRPGTIYTTNTTHTPTGSVHSLGSGYTSPARVISPLPAQVSNREDYIEPFTLRSTSPSYNVRSTSPPVTMPHTMRRQTSEGTLQSAANTYDSSIGMTLVQDEYTPASPQRARLNPPAYSPYPSPTASPEPADSIPLPMTSPVRAEFTPGHRTRNEKGSADTQRSYDSGTSHVVGGSISEVIGRMGLVTPESVVGSTMAGHTVATGQSANVVGRPTHKPNISNPDNETG
ncbi:hypothetical protein DFH06DRAFT_1331813 [Mycena polygramma]|nr:hypothetical protein DFH06DRAFT_1331813 [Mycena polygramma]